MRAHALLVVLAVLVVACGGGDGVPGGTGSTPSDTASPTPTAEPSESAKETASPQAVCGTYEPGSQVTDEAVLLVTEPTEDGELPPGATVTGCTNAFEAAFQWELLDAAGEVLASGNETATCGSGCLGTFSFTVDYEVDAAQEGTLRVFTESAEDGSIQDERRVPVRLAP